MPDGAKPARLTIGGVEQNFYSEVESEVDPNDKPLETIPGGMVGHSDGSSMHKINGMSIVPTTGREFDFYEAADKHRTTDLGIRCAGVTREYRGRFGPVSEPSKVGDTINIKWAFTGRRIR
jgi:hypothetical protein